MSSPTVVPLNTYGAAWGPPLIATFIAAIVYGISVLQTFYYFSHHGKRDGPGWLTLVTAIFVLDSAAMGLFMYCVYYYAILSWGIPEMLTPDVKEFPMEYILTSILALVVQCFYINTIRALRAPIIITILLFLTAFTAFVSGLILPAVQLDLVTIDKIVIAPLNHIAFNIARGTALACDVGIVAVLCWLFTSRKTGIRRANNVLDALIMFSVQRGVLQAIVQTGEVIAYAVQPSGLYFLPFHVIVSRIYCTSLLATLNSRDYVLSKGLSSHEHARKRRVEAGDAELGKVHAVEQNHDEERKEGPTAPPGLPVVTAEASVGRWASTLSGSHPVLTSFLEPPFLFSNSFASREDAGVSRSRSVRTSEMAFSSMIRSASESERPNISTQDLEWAQSMRSLASASGSGASESPVSPMKKERIEEY